MPSDALSFFGGMAPAAAGSGIDMYKFTTQMGARKDAQDRAYQAALARAHAGQSQADVDAAKLRFQRESEFIPPDQANAWFRAYGPRGKDGQPMMQVDRPISKTMMDAWVKGGDNAAQRNPFLGKYNPTNPEAIKAKVDDEVESLMKSGRIRDQNEAIKLKQDRYAKYAAEENKLRAVSGWPGLDTNYPGGDVVQQDVTRWYAPTDWLGLTSGKDYVYQNLPGAPGGQPDGFMLPPPPMGGPSPMQQGGGMRPTPRASNMLMPTPTPAYR